MYSKVTKRFIADGSAINVELGFVPDQVRAYAKLEETNPLIYEWYKDLSDASEDGQYGTLLTGSTGVVTKLSSGNGAISSYDTTSNQVLVPAPDGDGTTQVSVSDYADDTDYSSAGQARTTSQPGTVVRPTTHNGYVYECTVAGGTGGTEPTWPTTPGETVSDDNNTWICREENVIAGGAKGITIGSDLSTDGDDWLVIAEKHDRAMNGGDSASYDPV